MKTVAAVAVLFYLGSTVGGVSLALKVSRGGYQPRRILCFTDMHLVGCGDLDAPLPRERHEILAKFIIPTVGANFVRLLFGSPAGELDWRSQD